MQPSIGYTHTNIAYPETEESTMKQLFKRSAALVLALCLLVGLLPVMGAAAQVREVDLGALAPEDMPVQKEETASLLEEVTETPWFDTYCDIIAQDTVAFTYETVSGDSALVLLADLEEHPEITCSYHVLLQMVDLPEEQMFGWLFQDLRIDITITTGNDTATYVFYPTQVSGVATAIVITARDGQTMTNAGVVWSESDVLDLSLPGTATYISQETSGGFWVEWAPAEASTTAGNAVLFFSGDSNLGTVPMEDAMCLKRGLDALDQFSPQDTHLLDLSSGDDQAADKLKAKMDEVFGNNTDDTVSVLYYSGHGGVLADGSSFLGLGLANVTAADLRNWLSEYDGTFLIVLDCCFSGGMLMDAEAEGGDLAQSLAEALTVSEGAGYDPRFHVISAANSVETSMQTILGGQLATVFGYAIGVDRFHDNYHTVGGDENGDKEITLAEMEQFFSTQAVYSQPQFYPHGCTDTLFTYYENSDTLTAPTFTMQVKNNVEMVTKGEDGNYHAKVTITATNNTDQPRTLLVASVSENLQDLALMNGTLEDIKDACIDHWNYDITKKDVLLYETRWPIEAGTTDTWTFTLDVPKDEDGNPILGNAVMRVYDGADSEQIYRSQCVTLREELPEMDPTAVQFLSPAQGATVSNSVAVKVAFDTLRTDNTGYAPCRLTLTATPEEGGDVITVFENVQPLYSRCDIDSEGRQYSAYETIWDVSGLAGTYTLTLKCEYENGLAEYTSASREITIVDDSTLEKTINRLTVSMDYLERYLVMCTGMDSDGERITWDDLVWAWENGIKYALRSIGKVDVDVTWRDVSPETPVTSGPCTAVVTVTLPEDAPNRFGDGCQVELSGHDLIRADASADGRTLTFAMTHTFQVLDREDVTITGTLKEGETITFTLPNRWRIDSAENLYRRADGSYRLRTGASREGFALTLAYDDPAGKVCSYNRCRLMWNEGIAPAEFALEKPNKTNYLAGEPLDLTGGEVRINGESQPLTREMLENWDDSFLQYAGVHSITVTVDGHREERAFSIVVYDPQRTGLFELSEDAVLSTTPVGGMEQVAADDVYLYVSSSAEPADENTGIWTVTPVPCTVTMWSKGPVMDQGVYLVGGQETMSWLVPYPQGLDRNDNYQVQSVDTQGTRVTLEKRSDGLWITANRNATLTIAYEKVPDPVITDSGSTTTPAAPTVKADEATGTVTVTLPAGVTSAVVTVPAAVTPGTVAVDAATGKVLPCVPGADGLTVAVTGTTKLVLEDRSVAFPDAADHWAADAIAFTSARGLLNGTGDNAFAPETAVTRAMVWTVLARMAGADTESGEAWYSAGRIWAVNAGVSDGTDPEAAITREQLAVMLYRAAGSPAAGDAAAFPDAGAVSDYARTAMAWAVETGVLAGQDGNLAPQSPATRAQLATVLMRLLTAQVK